MKQIALECRIRRKACAFWWRATCFSLGAIGLVFPVLWYFVAKQSVDVTWSLWLILLPFVAPFLFPLVFLWQISRPQSGSLSFGLIPQEETQDAAITAQSIRFGPASRLWWALTWRLMTVTFVFYFLLKPLSRWVVSSILVAEGQLPMADDLFVFRVLLYALPLTGAATFVLAEAVMCWFTYRLFASNKWRRLIEIRLTDKLH